jgi:hypothetical protein
MAAAVRDVVHSLKPEQPVANVATMDDVVAKSLSQARFSMMLLGIFGLRSRCRQWEFTA